MNSSVAVGADVTGVWTFDATVVAMVVAVATIAVCGVGVLSFGIAVDVGAGRGAWHAPSRNPASIKPDQTYRDRIVTSMP